MTIERDLGTPGERYVHYYADGSTSGFADVGGALAATLGVQGGISDAQFQDLFEGQWNGEKVRQKAGSRDVKDADGKVIGREAVSTPGIDIEFSVPKSVSLAFALAKDQETADAIAQIVMDSAKYAWTEGVQNHVMGARVRVPNGKPGPSPQVAMKADLLSTFTLQHAARPNKATEERGGVVDPHLHVHCFTFTSCQVDGKWYTFDEAGIKRTALYRNDIFMSEVARRLEAMGVELDYTSDWSPLNDLEAKRYEREGKVHDRSRFDRLRKGYISFEVKGIERKLVRFASSNHERKYQLINDFEAKHGRKPTEVEVAKMMRVTRSKKQDKDMDARPDRARWVDHFRRHGFEAPLYSRGERVPLREDRFAILHERLMGPKGLLLSEARLNSPEDEWSGPTVAACTGASIKESLIRCSIDLGITKEELAAYEAKLRDELIVLRPANDDRFALFTTQVQLDKEQYITDRRRQKVQDKLLGVPEAVIQRVIAEQSVDLDGEQIEAVRRAVSTSGWVHIDGYAGAGKSTTARAIAEVLREGKRADEVIALSVANKTAVEFGQKVDADHSGSIESILSRIERGKIQVTDRTVWMIDEAAMVDTHRLSELLKATGRGRVVLIGDPEQLNPIGPAGWYQESVAEHGSATLTAVHRQTDARDIADYEFIRKGRADIALENLAERGRIHITEDEKDRMAMVMADYRAWRDEGHAAADIRQVIETSNQDVDTMNRFVQRDRMGRGEVGGNSYTVEDSEQGRRWTLREGDQVLFLRSYFEKGGVSIPNGTTATVMALQTEQGGERAFAHLMTDKGMLPPIWINKSEKTQALGLAYAQHAQKMQGGQAKMVQVLPSPQSDQQRGYSTMTRSEEASHVYIDRESFGPQAKERLSEVWRTRVHKITALSMHHATERVQPSPEGRDFGRPQESPEAKQRSRADRLLAAMGRGNARPRVRERSREIGYDL
ncbi:AAA family ATPase [Kineococcus sp. T13]|uniref:AAA family ATPase n=1 Tax=Kineococcus vitellinus TaxID=2696565 RepID=UPI0014128139|nr:AAA family ATPase [Kineococcus vitellinus]